MLVRQLDSLLRPAREYRRDGEDHGAVAVARVPFGALRVIAARRLL
jgi:hypothetical protein